jgi:hypothetical protein
MLMLETYTNNHQQSVTAHKLLKAIYHCLRITSVKHNRTDSCMVSRSVLATAQL